MRQKGQKKPPKGVTLRGRGGQDGILSHFQLVFMSICLVLFSLEGFGSAVQMHNLQHKTIKIYC